VDVHETSGGPRLVAAIERDLFVEVDFGRTYEDAVKRGRIG